LREVKSTQKTDRSIAGDQQRENSFSLPPAFKMHAKTGRSCLLNNGEEQTDCITGRRAQMWRHRGGISSATPSKDIFLFERMLIGGHMRY
jgi:hypothetical protein